MSDPALQLMVNPGDDRQVAAALARVASMVDPAPSIKITAGAEGAVSANKRRFSIRVTDRLAQPWERRWVVHVYITGAADGDPSATGNTVAFNAGTVLETLIPNAEYRVLATTAGLVELDLTIAGAATRHVYALPERFALGSGAVAWA